MYIPQHFQAPDLMTMHALMAAKPLATLVTLHSGHMDANHIPLHFEPQASPNGSLQGHIAKANPMYAQADGEIDALAIFHGPDSYVSPNWYPVKQEHGKVVPTWNYIVVHARGKLRFIDDLIWIRAQLDNLTASQEATFTPPWKPEDAPAEYIDRMMAAIVGIEIAIETLEGKWKMSQNQSAQNRQGVITGLEAAGVADGLEIAAWIAAEHKR
jgi:transcriptional regulator